MSRSLALLLTAALASTSAAAYESEAASQGRPTAAASAPASAAAVPAGLEDLTPQNAVLVYVDFNSGLDNLGTTVPGPQYRNNVAAFAKLSGIFGMPTAVFGEENDFYGPFYPEIKQLATAGAPNFLRTTPSGYTPEFARWLQRTGRKNVIIGGLSIDNCVLHTSLDLIRNGYKVFFLPDVSPTNTPLALDAAAARLVRAGATPMTWVTASTDLVGDWNTPQGRLLMPVMQQHLRAATVGTPVDPTPDGKGF